MPRDKDLKRLVRTRMKKTGEAYTTARAHILEKPARRKTAKDAVAEAPPPPPDYAGLAGMSDETIAAKTGCTWERWVYSLDRHRAYELPHREIAALVSEKYDIPGWWAQTVTVGYERIKGLRDVGQRRGGSYEASKSRTFRVPVAKLFDACADAATRRRWIADVEPVLRTARKARSIRFDWPDGTHVTFWFTEKDASKSSLAVTHAKLQDRRAVEERKQYWSERLDALGEALAG